MKKNGILEGCFVNMVTLFNHSFANEKKLNNLKLYTIWNAIIVFCIAILAAISYNMCSK